MMQRKIVYSEIALSKRKAIKKEIKEKYGRESADKFSKQISETIAKLKEFSQMGVSIREAYGLDCDYYLLFVAHNYFIYRSTDNYIIILEIFHEKEDFMYQMFGVVTTSQDTLDFWGEDV